MSAGVVSEAGQVELRKLLHLQDQISADALAFPALAQAAADAWTSGTEARPVKDFPRLQAAYDQARARFDPADARLRSALLATQQE